ncbi:sensor domain-containing diguanylate cyclase [Litorilituus sediminis]|uniref:sensor domain-containing diguanylate cyclase n=1 Tax=Litorilituus sediminis TaxID=718192 RepID=UPI001FE8B13B|nr:diguanylate cyclase [Litorilituus sediminis]
MLMVLRSITVIVMLTLVGAKFAFANVNQPFVYSLEQSSQTIDQSHYYLVNSANEQTLAQLVSNRQITWSKRHAEQGDMSLKAGKNIFYFQVRNDSQATQSIYISIINQVRIVRAQALNYSDGQAIGDAFTLNELVRQSNNTLSTQISLPPQSIQNIYIEITSSSALRSSMQLYTEAGYLAASQASQFQQGVGLGGMISLTIAMFLLYIASRNSTMLLLTTYLLVRTLILSAFLGLNLYYFLPEFDFLRGMAEPLLISISSIVLLMFTNKLFNIAKHEKQLNRIINAITWLFIAYIPVSLFIPAHLNVAIIMLTHTASLLFLTGVGLYLHKHQQRLALLFSVIMAIKCISILVLISAINWLDIGFAQYKGQFYIGLFWFDAFLLTFILSRQYAYQLRDKQQAQKHALEHAKVSEQAQQELLQLQQDNQNKLENRVQERTLELNIALQELEEVNQELERKNIIDEMTGLFNRRHYDQKILAEYRRSKRNLTPLSLVIIDIDHFKKVNDTYGHLAGDQCLIWLSVHIKQCLKRSTDMAFRYGGEEFCLILPDTENHGAFSLAESLRENIARHPFHYQESEIPITISCGVCTYQQQNDVEPEQIFSGADNALYKAKNSGRNQTQTYQFTEAD